MSTAVKKGLGEIIKDEMIAKGINGSAVARKMNVSRQIINQIDKKKRFDYEFLQRFKEASGLDYTRFAIEQFSPGVLEDPASKYGTPNNVTLNFTVSCDRNRVGEFSNFLSEIDRVAENYGFKII